MTDYHRTDRRWAEHEYRLYKQHGRPSRPYYMKCLRCEDIWEIEGTLLDADYDVRRHAGIHSGLHEEHAEIVVTDATGREVFRHHAIHTPEQEPDPCPNCGADREDNRITCPGCGYIPEDDRLMPDGGL